MKLETNHIYRYLYTVIILFFSSQASVFAQVNFNSSNIPIIIIETNGKDILDDPKIVADMKIIDNGENINYLSDPANGYNGKISIEIRGSTSQSFPKKQYGFETQNSDGTNYNVSLLGLPPENDWILSAPYSDKTLIRNILVYKLSETLGHYAPRTKLCELLLNGEYMGVYVLTEKIKRDNNRVNISKLESDDVSGDDLTGGYIIKIDKSTGNSGPMWHSKFLGLNFQYEYPKYDEISSKQKDYIKNYIYSFEQALSSYYFMDLEIGYRKYIDVKSFVDFFIVNEVSKNIDGYFLSTFLFKDKDSKGGKLTMGPVWDFNLSFGNADYREGFLTDGFQVHINPSPWWWDRLLQDSTFVNDIKNRWCSIRDDLFSDQIIFSTIDSLSVLLDEAQQRNAKKWKVIGYDIWPNYYVGESYEDEIDYLKSWTSERLNWLDDNLSSNESIGLINEIKIPEPNVYPNPFRDKISYTFSLDKRENVSLVLYSINGTQVATILDDVGFSEGEYTINWDSSKIPGSIYLLELKYNREIISRKKVIKL